MEDAARYKKYAEGCKRLAKTMSLADRKVMLEIAEAWLVCAKGVEQRETAKNDRRGRDLSNDQSKSVAASADDQTPGELLEGEGDPGLTITGGCGHA